MEYVGLLIGYVVTGTVSVTNCQFTSSSVSGGPQLGTIGFVSGVGVNFTNLTLQIVVSGSNYTGILIG